MATLNAMSTSLWSARILWGDSRNLANHLDKDGSKESRVAPDMEKRRWQRPMKGWDLIIVKHAPIFRPISDLVASRSQNQIYIDLIKHDIAVCAVTPRWHRWEWSQWLVLPDVRYWGHDLSAGNRPRWIGRDWKYSNPQTFGELAQHVKRLV